MYLWRWVQGRHNRVDAMVIQRGGLEGMYLWRWVRDSQTVL